MPSFVTPPSGIKRKLKFACAFGAVLTTGLTLISPEAALASTCAVRFYYSGQQQPPAWQGIEGYMNITTLGLGASNSSHILNLEELKNFGATVCTGIAGVGGNCWLQDGYGRGALPPPCRDSGAVYAYEENNDINGYNCNWVRSISLPQNNFWNVYYTGQTSGSNGLLNGYINTGGGPILIGQAWVPNQAANLRATTFVEVYSAVAATCPSVAPYEYFGTNGHGTTNGTYAFYLSPNGRTWNIWTQTPTFFNDAPYNNRIQLGNYYAFRTYGS